MRNGHQRNKQNKIPIGLLWKIVTSSDSKYVLVDVAGTVYQLDDQTTAKKFVGKIVKVSGIVDETNNAIHVTDITPAVEQAVMPGTISEPSDLRP